jgi:hypothetical protein
MRETGLYDQEFQAQPMTWAEAPLAYPLVYLHDASISLDVWRDFVSRRMQEDNETRLIIIRDRINIVHAMFAYRVDFDIKGQRQLCIAQLIVAQIPGSQIDRAIVASTGHIANDLGCAKITIEQPFEMSRRWPAQTGTAA